MNLAIVKKNSILFFVLSCFLFSACTKVITTDIGTVLLPGGSSQAKDMFLNVVTKNAGDSVNHVAPSQDFSLGYIGNDPLFGKVNASVNVQLNPTAFPVEFGTYQTRDSVKFDSVVLVLSYKGVYGDSFQNLSFRVYQISNDEPFRADSAYSTSHFFQHTNELTENFQPATINPRGLWDSVHPFNEQATAQVRIRLDKSFGNRLIYALDTSNAYKSDSIFNQYFRGLQIVPQQTTGNSLLRINISDTNTKLAIYYRFYNGTGVLDTAVTYFKASAGVTAAANYIKRDRSGAEVQNYYPSGNTQDSMLYVDASPGIFSSIQFPALTGLGNIIIQRAELLADGVPDNSDLFLTPPRLFLTPYSTATKWRFVTPNTAAIAADSTGISNLSSLGTNPIIKIDPLTGRNRYSYSFDITRYVQGVITRGEQAYNFVLFAPGNDYIYATETLNRRIPVSSIPINAPAQGRVRLGGGNNTAHQMRLHIVYTQVP